LKLLKTIHNIYTLKDKFKFNPFSGVFEEDLEFVIVPRFDIDKMILKIKDPHPIAIEFLGKHGRGKTTHLKFLHQQISEYPIYFLNNSSSVKELLDDESKVVFVDGIHHLNLKDRIQLFRAKQTIIYTTHWSRIITGVLGQKNISTINFNGINTQMLMPIINKRLKLAAHENLDEFEEFTEEQAALLIEKFGDDYRGIINYLFKKHQ